MEKNIQILKKSETFGELSFDGLMATIGDMVPSVDSRIEPVLSQSFSLTPA